MRTLYLINENREVLKVSATPEKFVTLELVGTKYHGFFDEKNIGGFEDYNFTFTDEKSVRQKGVTSLAMEWGARILTIPIVTFNSSTVKNKILQAKINNFFTTTMRLFHEYYGDEGELQTVFIDIYKPYDFEPIDTFDGVVYSKTLILSFKADNPYWKKGEVPTIEDGIVTGSLAGFSDSYQINTQNDSNNVFNLHYTNPLPSGNVYTLGYLANYVATDLGSYTIDINTDNVIKPQLIIQGYCENPEMTVQNEAGTFTFKLNVILQDYEMAIIEDTGQQITVTKVDLRTGEQTDISKLYEGDVIILTSNNNIIDINFDSPLSINYTPEYETVLVEKEEVT